jgi:hypothetical protein
MKAIAVSVLTGLLLLTVCGCATSRDMIDVVKPMVASWDIELDNGTRIEIGVGQRSEYYTYAEITGIEGNAEGRGDAADPTTDLD